MIKDFSIYGALCFVILCFAGVTFILGCLLGSMGQACKNTSDTTVVCNYNY